MKESINIYLADDHQIIIDGLTLLLKNEPNLVIVGNSTDGQIAFEEILNSKPDIALIDIKMPNKDGLDLIKNLKGKVKTKFIIVSMHNEKRYVNDAINYGALGYLLKNAGKDELLKTIFSVLKGDKCFPIFKPLVQSKKTFLTPRELDILQLIIKEYSSQEIAKKLSLSQYTIDTHRKNILKKTGAKNSAGLVKYAIDNDISFS